MLRFGHRIDTRHPRVIIFVMLLLADRFLSSLSYHGAYYLTYPRIIFFTRILYLA